MNNLTKHCLKNGIQPLLYTVTYILVVLGPLSSLKGVMDEKCMKKKIICAK